MACARSTTAPARPSSCSPSAARCPTGTARRCPTTGPSCRRTRRRTGACSCRSTRRSRCPTVGERGPHASRPRRGATASTSAPATACSGVVLDDGRVVGVEADAPRTARAPDRRAQGGGLRHRRLHPRRRAAHQLPRRARLPAAARRATNEGDFVRIASAVGAQLRNMNYAWMCPVPLERSGASGPRRACSPCPATRCCSSTRPGGACVNEKLPYNELAQAFFRWDGTAGEYPNLVLVQIWDQRSQEHSASDEYGRLIVPRGRRRLARHPRRHAGRAGRRRSTRGWRACRRGPVALAARGRLRGDPARHRRAVQRACRDGPGRGLPPRRARRPAAVQRPGQGGAGPGEPDAVAAGRAGPVLRRAGHRRHARHQGRPADRHPTARCSTTPASPIPGPLRRGQLRGLGVRPGRTGRGGATLGPIIAFAHRAAPPRPTPNSPHSRPSADNDSTRRTAWPSRPRP